VPDYKEFIDYRSPFAEQWTPNEPYLSQVWRHARDCYAETGEQKYKDAMLSFVSSYCPPDAPKPKPSDAPLSERKAVTIGMLGIGLTIVIFTLLSFFIFG
jgi:hypothetical protein